MHSSALLASFISIDRYFTIILRPGSKLPFGTPRKALIWSATITLLVVLINFHILILNGHTTTAYENRTISLDINESIFEFKETSDFTCEVYRKSLLFNPWGKIESKKICHFR